MSTYYQLPWMFSFDIKKSNPTLSLISNDFFLPTYFPLRIFPDWRCHSNHFSDYSLSRSISLSTSQPLTLHHTLLLTFFAFENIHNNDSSHCLEIAASLPVTQIIWTNFSLIRELMKDTMPSQLFFLLTTHKSQTTCNLWVSYWVPNVKITAGSSASSSHLIVSNLTCTGC